MSQMTVTFEIHYSAWSKDFFYPLKLGTVVFYDGSRARFATDHQFQFPNGINFDPAGR